MYSTSKVIPYDQGTLINCTSGAVSGTPYDQEHPGHVQQAVSDTLRSRPQPDHVQGWPVADTLTIEGTLIIVTTPEKCHDLYGSKAPWWMYNTSKWHLTIKSILIMKYSTSNWHSYDQVHPDHDTTLWVVIPYDQGTLIMTSIHQ